MKYLKKLSFDGEEEKFPDEALLFEKVHYSTKRNNRHSETRNISLLISSHSNMTRKRTQPIPGSQGTDKSRVSTSTIRSPDELIRDTRIPPRHVVNAIRLMDFHGDIQIIRMFFNDE